MVAVLIIEGTSWHLILPLAKFPDVRSLKTKIVMQINDFEITKQQHYKYLGKKRNYFWELLRKMVAVLILGVIFFLFS